MAKSTPKKAESTSKPVKKAAAKPKVSAVTIEKACEMALDKLRNLNLDYQLQSEIEWCLGSYRVDGNPIGLYQMIERALRLFEGALVQKTKGITAKFVGDLKKALEAR